MTWTTVPYEHEAKDVKRLTLHLVRRDARSAALYASLSIYKLISASYVEIQIDDTHTLIRLIPKRVKSAYSRTVTTDHKTKAHIAGGAKLFETEDLTFKKQLIQESK